MELIGMLENHEGRSHIQNLQNSITKEESKMFKLLEKENAQMKKQEQNSEKMFMKKYREKVYKDFGEMFTKNMIDLVIDNNYFKQWKDEDLAKAIAIYNTSSRCYQYLREQLHFPLPSKSTVLKCLAKIDFSSGIIWPVMSLMRNEFSEFTPLQRAAVICFDEIYIDGRVSCDFKKERILGPHKTMLIISVRSIAYQWKQIAYYGFDVRLTKAIIEEVVTVLHRIGVNVYGLISDMATINVRLWKDLGIVIDLKDESKSVYHFLHPCDSHKIWLFADYPHMLKLLRNHFIDKPIKLGPDFNNVIISVEAIRKLIKIQESSDLQLTFKLTNKHLNLSKRQRMNVRKAFELFSATVAKALEYLLPEYKELSEFIKLVNDASDLLNVRTNQDNQNPCKAAFGKDLNVQTKILEKLSKNVTEFRIQDRRPAIKPFQKGIKLTCSSIQGMFKDLNQPPVNLDFLMTNHCNQDYVESTFGAMRGVGGFNDHPLPLDAIHRLKSVIISTNIRCPRTGNVHQENGMEFVSSGRLSILADKRVRDPIEDYLYPEELEKKFRGIPTLINFNIPTQVTLEEKSLHGASQYLAGFISKKLLKSYPEMQAVCGGGWINVLSNGRLTYPSDWWFCTFMKLEEYFEEFHKSRNNGWNLNNEMRFITPLQKYLYSIYPAIPEKALQLYLKTRTKIRVTAINKKILQLKRNRRAHDFFEPPHPNEEEEQDNPFLTQDYEINEIEAMMDMAGGINEEEDEEEEEEEELLDV
jgi:hypothetical protein